MGLHRDFKGVWIPKKVWMSKDLTLQEKILYVEIDSLDNGTGCFAGNKHFAIFLGLSKKRVSGIINNLVKKGYVSSRIEYVHDSQEVSKRYLKIIKHPILPIPEKETGIPKKAIGTPKSKAYSNTVSNTCSNTQDKSKHKIVDCKQSTVSAGEKKGSISIDDRVLYLVDELIHNLSFIGIDTDNEQTGQAIIKLQERLRFNRLEDIMFAIMNYCMMYGNSDYNFDIKYSLVELLTIDRLEKFINIDIDSYLWTETYDG